MNGLSRLVAAAALAALALGCSQKDPADAAINAAEDALAAVAEDAQKYAPEQYAEVKAMVEEARGAFSEERYKDAIAAVKDVPARAEELAGVAAKARDEAMARLGEDWNRLSSSLPGMVGGIEARVEELGKMRRLPKGMDADMLEQAKAALADTKGSWEQASASFTAGKMEEAVALAREVETKAQDLMTRLGMQAG